MPACRLEGSEIVRKSRFEFKSGDSQMVRVLGEKSFRAKLVHIEQPRHRRLGIGVMFVFLGVGEILRWWQEGVVCAAAD